MSTRFRLTALLISLLLILSGCYSPPPSPTTAPTASHTPEPTETLPPPTATDAPTATATAEPLDIDPALAAWLQQSAIPFETTAAGSGFDDLQALKPLIGDARIVGLGEATHGTHEFFQMKHRLLEFMVEEMGFTTFALEVGFIEAETVDAYVQGGAGSGDSLVRQTMYAVWMNQEMLDLIEWMRAYNADKAPDQRIHFRGFDMQTPASARGAIKRYIAQVDAAALPQITDQLACVQRIGFGLAYEVVSEADRAACRANLQAVVDHLTRSEAAYSAQTTPAAFANTLQAARIILQAEAMFGEAMRYQSFGIRDQAMAENIAWLLDQAGSESRMVLWAHNMHITAQPASAVMGDHLRQRFGADYLAVGFSFNQGSVLAFDMDSTPEMTEFALEPAPAGSIDDTLRAAQMPRFILDLRDAPPDAAAWLNTFRPMRFVGGSYSDACPQAAFAMVAPAQGFDVLIYVEDTTAADYLSGVNDGPPPSEAAISFTPINLDFEERTRCWFDDGTGGITVRADGQAAHSGSTSLSATARATTPDARHAVTQQVIPLDYAGKRVRIIGYVRTSELDGHAGLTFAAYGMGLYTVLAESETPADQALRADTDWTQLELIVDIPADTLLISFGLYVIGSGEVWIDDFAIEIVP